MPPMPAEQATMGGPWGGAGPNVHTLWMITIRLMMVMAGMMMLAVDTESGEDGDNAVDEHHDSHGGN